MPANQITPRVITGRAPSRQHINFFSLETKLSFNISAVGLAVDANE